LLEKAGKDLRIERIESKDAKKKIRLEKKLYVEEPKNPGEERKVKETEVAQDARASLYDSSTRVLYYILDESVTNPDLFTEMVQYLY